MPGRQAGLRRVCWSRCGGHCCPPGHPLRVFGVALCGAAVPSAWHRASSPWRACGPRGFLGSAGAVSAGHPLLPCPISLDDGFGLWQHHLLLRCMLGTNLVDAELPRWLLGAVLSAAALPAALAAPGQTLHLCGLLQPQPLP